MFELSKSKRHKFFLVLFSCELKKASIVSVPKLILYLVF